MNALFNYYLQIKRKMFLTDATEINQWRLTFTVYSFCLTELIYRFCPSTLLYRFRPEPN